MTRIQTLISSIVIIIMIGSSIIQFHHHDANGTMCMYFSSAQTTATSGNHEHLYPSCCSKDHSMEDSQHQDESRCSLKLSSVKDTKPLSIKDFSSGVITLIALLSDCCLEHKTSDKLPVGYGYTDFKLPESHVLHFQLRAPPALS